MRQETKYLFFILGADAWEHPVPTTFISRSCDDHLNSPRYSAIRRTDRLETTSLSALIRTVRNSYGNAIAKAPKAMFEAELVTIH